MRNINLLLFLSTFLILFGCGVESKITEKEYICGTNDSNYSPGFKRSLFFKFDSTDSKLKKFPVKSNSQLKFSTYDLPILCSISGNSVTFGETSCDEGLKIQFDPISGSLVYWNQGPILWNCQLVQ
jgi:hypothetical protein